MANEKTSKGIARLASLGLRKPSTLTTAQIRKLAASALTQAPNKPKPRKPSK